MKKTNVLKSVIGILLMLVITFGMVMIPVEARAEAAPRMPLEGDDSYIYFWDVTVPCEDNKERNKKLIDTGSFASYTISKRDDLLSADWPSDLVVYVTKYTFGSDSVAVLTYRPTADGMWERNNNGRSCSGSDNPKDVIADYFNNMNAQTINDYYIAEGMAAYWEVYGPPTPAPEPYAGDGSAHVHKWVFGTIYEATESADGLEGEYCSCGAIKNTSVITSGGVIVNNTYAMIDAAKPGQNIVLDMKMMCNLSQEFMKKLASKNTCSYTLRLIYKNKLYEYYIPAGAVFDTSLEYYGPEKLMEMFEYIQK